MQVPQQLSPRAVAADTWLLGAWIPLPGLGMLPANAYVIRAREPVLVDTGLAALRDDFLHSLGTVMDPADLRWIWVTHMDPDHVGNLSAVLQLAPRARVVTNYLGMGKMGLLGLPQERAYLVNPGQALDAGDRTLAAVVPPVFDAPETTGLLDSRSRAFFCADAFGTVQQAAVDDAHDIGAAALRDGMRLWTRIDAPWLRMADPSLLRATLGSVRDLRPAVVLGSHLQPARGMDERLLSALADAAGAPFFVGPDQRALEAMMAGVPVDVAEAVEAAEPA